MDYGLKFKNGKLVKEIGHDELVSK